MSDATPLSRRSFLAGATAAAVAAGAARPLSSQSWPTALSAVDAVDRMVRGELTAERYAAELLARCAAWSPLNAFITLDPQRVLEDARARDKERLTGGVPGPLFGLPLPIKDSVDTAQYPTTGGTPALRHFRPSTDAPVVHALRSAGGIVLGKTNLHELSFGWTSNNLAYGAVHNPYNLARIPGGSSGGTAAAVAARLAPLGLAEDTEGSIRVPAAFCGIAGFRPTTGRYSTQGCIPITGVFDQVGPHARSVGDLALFDTVMTGAAAALVPMPLKGVRLGVVRDYWFKDLDPEVERVTDLALRRLTAAGAVLVEGSMPELGRLIERTTLPVQNYDASRCLTRYLDAQATGITLEQLVAAASPDIQAIFRSDVLPGAPRAVSAAVYTAAINQHLPALRRQMAAYFKAANVAALVFPATLVPPPLIGEETQVSTSDGRHLDFEYAVARNIAPGSTAGLPGLVLPAGLTAAGLPVALEFDAPSGADRALLALGLSLEKALGPLAPPAAPATAA